MDADVPILSVHAIFVGAAVAQKVELVVHQSQGRWVDSSDPPFKVCLSKLLLISGSAP